MKIKHIPVLKVEVIDYLNLEDGKIVVDGTLGLGGHSEAILEKIEQSGKLIGLDKDIENLESAKLILGEERRNVYLFNKGFEDLLEVLSKLKIKKVDGVLLDLGLSSVHVDSSEKGFSFRSDGPLDMRFNRSDTKSMTAGDLLNSYSEKELMKVLKYYAEEKKFVQIARKIVEIRKVKLFQSTKDLKDLIEFFYPGERNNHHHLARIFQGIRIEVNNELEVLKKGLDQAFQALKKEGRMVVISYHSLEDRIVKNFFKEKFSACICPPQKIICDCGKKRELKILTRKPIIPNDEEIFQNSRSRSAKLRAIEKI